MARRSLSPRAIPIPGQATSQAAPSLIRSLQPRSIPHTTQEQKITHRTSSIPGIPRGISVSRFIGTGRHTCPGDGVAPPPSLPKPHSISPHSRHCSALSTASATPNTRNRDRPSSSKVCQERVQKSIPFSLSCGTLKTRARDAIPTHVLTASRQKIRRGDSQGQNPSTRTDTHRTLHTEAFFLRTHKKEGGERETNNLFHSNKSFKCCALTHPACALRCLRLAIQHSCAPSAWHPPCITTLPTRATLQAAHPPHGRATCAKRARARMLGLR